MSSVTMTTGQQSSTLRQNEGVSSVNGPVITRLDVEFQTFIERKSLKILGFCIVKFIQEIGCRSNEVLIALLFKMSEK